jgi:hypothetical protein
MQRFVFLIVVVISGFASLFSPAQNRPLFCAAFSFGTVNTAIISTELSATTESKGCSELYGFHLSVANSFTEPFAVVADFSTCFDNRVNPFGTTVGEVKFSLCNFCESQARFASRSRFTPLPDMTGVLRNLHVKLANSGTSRNTSFGMNFEYKPSNAFCCQPLRFNSDSNFLRNHTVNSTARSGLFCTSRRNETLKLETTEPLGAEPCWSF